MGWKIDPKTGKATYVFDNADSEALNISNSSAIAAPSAPTSYTEASGYGVNGGLPEIGTASSTGLFGLGTTDQWGTAMGLGGLAMKAIALPQQMEYYGAQTDLAKQQLASNQQAMADKKAFNAGWANASNSVMGSGLANRSFTGAAGYGTGTIGSTNPVLKNGN